MNLVSLFLNKFRYGCMERGDGIISDSRLILKIMFLHLMKEI